MVRPFNPMMLNRGKPAEKKKKKDSGPPKTLTEKLLLYVTFSLSVVLVGGATSLVFLGLLVVDPALATIAGHFIETPVDCRVVHSQYILGENYKLKGD